MGNHEALIHLGESLAELPYLLEAVVFVLVEVGLSKSLDSIDKMAEHLLVLQVEQVYEALDPEGLLGVAVLGPLVQLEQFLLNLEHVLRQLDLRSLLAHDLSDYFLRDPLCSGASTRVRLRR